MTKLLLALSVFVSLTAQAQILGELQGTGQIQFSFTNIDGSKDMRTSSCEVAMNIRGDETFFALDFSFFSCPQVSTWNDNAKAYRIVDGKLVDANGVQKGSVLEDGSIQFTERSVKVEKYADFNYDFNCRIVSGGNKTVELVNLKTYNFKKVANTWQVRRQTDIDYLTWTTKRNYPNCPSVSFPTKLGSTSDLSVTVK